MTNYLASSLIQRSVRRRAFFSFHYKDVMRVNNVRQAWRISHPDSDQTRGFYDASLWESKKLEGDEALKRLIREGVENTSAVCVLIGSQTWARRWVRYEIARAIVDNKGLLGVHINSLAHHLTKAVDFLGPNPLSYLAISKVQQGLLSTPRYFLFEAQGNKWVRYADYTLAVSLPSWLPEPASGYVTPLDQGAYTYDYCSAGGHRNIGSWIDAAARQAGR